MDMNKKVAELQRGSIRDNLGLLRTVLRVDEDLDENEALAEILRLCLFDRDPRENPVVRFRNQTSARRFDTPEEFAQREGAGSHDWPMSDVEFEALKKKLVVLDDIAWGHAQSAKPFELVRRLLERADGQVLSNDPQLVKFLGYSPVDGFPKDK